MGDAKTVTPRDSVGNGITCGVLEDSNNCVPN